MATGNPSPIIGISKVGNVIPPLDDETNLNMTPEEAK